MSESRDIIRNRILANTNDKYDKMTGSFIFEQAQATAIELEGKYAEIEDALNQKFAGTADFENLKVIAFERGVDWKEATFASGIVTVTGVEGASIKEGDLFASELNQYKSLEEKTLDSKKVADIKVECTTAGITGNTPVGTIINFPKTLVGINSVTNQVEFKNGFDAETRDELLKRYYIVIRKPATSGNVYHYEQWALEVEGVGDVKVKPLWNGNGTVKVVIIDRNKVAATLELIKATQVYIDSQRPIGASVTVTTAEKLKVDVTCKIQLKADYTLEQVKLDVTNKISEYFKDTTFIDSTVYYAKIGNILFTAEGVVNIDYSTLQLNNQKNDIILVDNNTKTQIPKLGVLNLTI